MFYGKTLTGAKKNTTYLIISKIYATHRHNCVTNTNASAESILYYVLDFFKGLHPFWQISLQFVVKHIGLKIPQRLVAKPRLKQKFGKMN